MIEAPIATTLKNNRRRSNARLGRCLAIGAVLFLAVHQASFCQLPDSAPQTKPPQSAGPESTSNFEPALTKESQTGERQPVESEIIVEGLGSFGHFHMFANSWWSDLYLGGVEYDRHSWGEFLGAQMDYVAELQPVAILRQASKTDVWGNRLSPARELVPGMGIMPIGLRMMWRSNQAVKPYFLAKGGLIGFTKKALSQDGSYANLSLEFSLGVQFHLKDRLDMRVGFADYHFSDAFIVPSNPGLDSMTYTTGLSYHLGKRNQSR